MSLEQIDPGTACTANRPPAMAVVRMTCNNIVVEMMKKWGATMGRVEFDVKESFVVQLSAAFSFCIGPNTRFLESLDRGCHLPIRAAPADGARIG